MTGDDLLHESEFAPYWIDRIHQLTKIAQSDYPIFIVGETGVGKDFVAMQIHNISSRAGNFVHLNLAAIPHDLIEIELFGAVPGAFTDGKTHRAGKFSQANDGTLYIDNIHELPPAIQAKLLHVLEEHSYYQLGSETETTMNCRIITSSLIAPWKLVASNIMREDLMYRLNVLPLQIPALQNRHADIPYFVRYFIEQNNRRNNSRFVAADSLLNYAILQEWKGNIRELHNYIQQCILESPADEILPLETASNEMQINLKVAVNQYKKNLIRAILQQYSGNVSKAAIAMGIQRTYLSRLIKELSIFVSSGE